MKREQIQEKFRQAVEQTRHGKAAARRAAETTLKGMVEVYPWLRDYARLLGLSEFPGLTREFPWLAPPAKDPIKPPAAKTRLTDAPGRAAGDAAVAGHGRKTRQSCATAWVKPPAVRGYEYRQCYKPNCKCMKGGAWHGPYRYDKRRNGQQVHSEYVGK
jgi:hypothetical protein